MWREAGIATLVLHFSQGSQIPIGVKSHMLGIVAGWGGGGGGKNNRISGNVFYAFLLFVSI